VRRGQNLFHFIRLTPETTTVKPTAEPTPPVQQAPAEAAPEAPDYSKMTVKDLTAELKSRGVKGYSGKNKAALVEMLQQDDAAKVETAAETPTPKPQEGDEGSETTVEQAVQEEVKSRKKRSEVAAEKKEQAKKKFADAARKLIEGSGLKMTGKPLSHKEKARLAVDMVEAAVEYGVQGFKEYVFMAVEAMGDSATRNLAPYLEEAWKQAGPTEPGSVEEVLNEAHPEERAEPIPPSGDELTGIKKAVVNELRALVGLPEMEGSTPQSVEEWAETARATLSADPKAGERLVNELATNPRPISQHDAMLLQFRYRQLANELEPVVDEYFDAVKSGDAAAISVAKTAVLKARSAMTEFEEIIHPSKETWGRTGVALQQLLRKDFSLEAILRRGQEANAGEELSPEQTAELTAMANKLEELQKQFDAERKKREELERELASKKQHEEAVNEAKKNRVRKKSERRKAAEKKVDDAWKDYLKDAEGLAPSGLARAKLLPHAVKLAKAYFDLGVVRVAEFLRDARSKAGKTFDEELFREAWTQAKQERAAEKDVDMADLRWLTKEAREIQRALVESGLIDRDAVIDAVHEEMQTFLPDFTRRQTMDALSAYGQFSQPSQGEIDTLIREMNAEVLKLSQIDTLETALARAEELRAEGKTDEEIGNQLAKEGLLVKATGLLRDKPTEAVSQLTKKYNELKKGVPASSEDRVGMLQTAVASIERALANRIRDLNWEITHGERIVREKRERPTNEKIKELEAERDRLQKIHREMFPPTKKPLTREQKLANAIKAADRAIEALEKQLDTQNFDRTRRERLSSPELDAKRARLDQLRAQRDAAKQLELERWEGEGGAFIDPKEQAAKKAYMASLRKRIANYHDILAKGDFSPQPKKQPRKLSPAELKLKREMEDVRHDVLRKFAEYHLSHLHGIAWGADKVAEAAHLSRALMTSFDLSALLRQGGLPAMGHPVMAKNALVETIASIATTFDKSKAFNTQDFKWSELEQFLTGIDSRQAEFEFMHQLTQGPEGEFRLNAGLQLPSTDEAITRQEEVFQGRWGKLVPGIAVSSRLYTMILNKMRADLFDSMVQHLGRGGQVSMEEARVIADFVNVATGRADLGRFNGYAATLNTVFFAPRYVASRFQYLAMPFYLPFRGGVKANWRVKRAIYKEYGRTVTGMATVLGAIALAAQLFWDDDDEEKPRIELDANSSDFLKVRVGETRMDFAAGLSQVMVLSQRLLPTFLGGGKTKSTITGEVRDFDEGRPTTRADVLMRFARSKTAPVPGAIWTMTDDWTNVVGGKETVGSLMWNISTPLALRDIRETMHAQGVAKGTAMSVLAILGVGMQTYGPKTQYKTGTAGERKEQFNKFLEGMKWDTDDPAYSEFLTPEQMQKVAERRQEKRQSIVSGAALSIPDRKSNGEHPDRYKSEETYQQALKERENARSVLKQVAPTLEEAKELLPRTRSRGDKIRELKKLYP